MTNLFEVTVSRTIPARAEDVYDAWLDPKTPGGLWHDCEHVILQPVVDGLFYHSVEHQDRYWAHYGRFILLERGRKIEHTWMSEATKGLESVVSITLTPVGNDTELLLRHTGLPDDELGRTHENGWNFIVSALAEAFGHPKPVSR